MRKPRLSRRVLQGITLGIALTLVTAIPALGNTPDGIEKGVVAEYNGMLIDLAFSWSDAQACYIWQERGIAKCFDSEAEMDRWAATLDGGRGVAQDVEFSLQTARPGVTAERAALKCSGPLRLYDYTYYGGGVLSLRDRRLWQNLSNFGWNQRVSSFKVGPCSAYFADYNNGGGAWYPTYLSAAYNQWPTMTGGWNNDVSSIYIK